MIKKCKITHIINPPIYGVVNKPIREGHIVDLNCGQILTCLGLSTVDEILPTGAIVRLNKDNYKTDNSGVTKEITIKDSINIEPEEKITPVEEPTSDVIPEVEESKPSYEEVKTEVAPVEEPTSDVLPEVEKVEESKPSDEEVKTEVAPVEEPKAEDTEKVDTTKNNNIPPKKKRK